MSDPDVVHRGWGKTFPINQPGRSLAHITLLYTVEENGDGTSTPTAGKAHWWCRAIQPPARLQHATTKNISKLITATPFSRSPSPLTSPTPFPPSRTSWTFFSLVVRTYSLFRGTPPKICVCTYLYFSFKNIGVAITNVLTSQLEYPTQTKANILASCVAHASRRNVHLCVT